MKNISIFYFDKKSYYPKPGNEDNEDTVQIVLEERLFDFERQKKINHMQEALALHYNNFLHNEAKTFFEKKALNNLKIYIGYLSENNKKNARRIARHIRCYFKNSGGPINKLKMSKVR